MTIYDNAKAIATKRKQKEADDKKADAKKEQEKESLLDSVHLYLKNILSCFTKKRGFSISYTDPRDDGYSIVMSYQTCPIFHVYVTINDNNNSGFLWSQIKFDGLNCFKDDEVILNYFPVNSNGQHKEQTKFENQLAAIIERIL